MEQDHEVPLLLRELITVNRKGYNDLRTEIESLRGEMKEVSREHGSRLNRLEEFMFTTQGGLMVTRILAGASFLGALVSVGAAFSLS